MATLGQQLLAPESGWRRYNDTNNNFTYVGNWRYDSNPNTYLANHHYTSSTTGSVEFVFFGSKLRIIGHIYTMYYSQFVKVDIDGIYCGSYSQKGSLQYQILLFEKTGLELSVHHVKIYTTDIGLNFDAIDIDDTGYLANPVPVVKLLVQDDSLLKTISSGNLVTVCNTTDSDTIIENAFNTSGLSDLSLWNDSLTNQIVNSTFNIVAYRKYVE